MKELLCELKELDLAAYNRAFNWFKNVTGQLLDNPEKYFSEDGPYPLRDALLQITLQESVQSRKDWECSIWCNCNGNSAGAVVLIWTDSCDEPIAFCGYSNTPCEAILKCYIDAVDYAVDCEIDS